MSEETTLFELTSAIRFVPKYDCIGIPLFCLKPSNKMYIAETDDALVIEAFHPFTDDDVNIERVWEVEEGTRFFQIGDPVPIPVWSKGKQRIISASSSLQDLDEALGSDEQVAVRLRSTLEKARKSVAGSQSEQVSWRSGSEFLERYKVLFQDQLAADRHWVSAFRQALRDAHEQPLFFRDSKAIHSLDETATKWAAQCANKAETPVVRQFIDALQRFGGGRSAVHIAEALALLRHVVAKPSSARTLSKAIEAFSSRHSAPGLIDFLLAQQWNDQLKSSLDKAYRDLSQSLTLALIKGKRSEIDNYSRIFGERYHLPLEAKDLAEQISSVKRRELVILAERVLNTRQHDDSFHLRQSFAFEAIETARLLDTIQKLLNPEIRHRHMVWDQVGISDEVFEDLQQLAKARRE